MFEIIVIVIIIIIYKCSVNTPSSKAFKESIYRDQYEWLLEYSCEQFDKLGYHTEDDEDDALMGFRLKFYDIEKRACIARVQLILLNNYEELKLKHRYCIRIEYIRLINPDEINYYNSFCSYANESRTELTRSFLHRVERQKDMTTIYTCQSKWVDLETDMEKVHESSWCNIIWNRIKFIQKEVDKLQKSFYRS